MKPSVTLLAIQKHMWPQKNSNNSIRILSANKVRRSKLKYCQLLRVDSLGTRASDSMMFDITSINAILQKLLNVLNSSDIEPLVPFLLISILDHFGVFGKISYPDNMINDW